MICFVAHDPGAKNLLRPVFERALADNFSAQLIDLRDPSVDGVASIQDAALVVAGASTNHREQELFQAVRRRGARTIQIIELLYRLERLHPLGLSTAADRYIVTHPLSVEKLRQDLLAVGAEKTPIDALGSPHLEHVAQTVPELSREEVCAFHFVSLL